MIDLGCLPGDADRDARRGCCAPANEDATHRVRAGGEEMNAGGSMP